MCVFAQSVFGEKLAKECLFDSDYLEDPRLPSPNQLKYKIMLKNKKIGPVLKSAQLAPSSSQQLNAQLAGRTRQISASVRALSQMMPLIPLFHCLFKQNSEFIIVRWTA